MSFIRPWLCILDTSPNAIAIVKRSFPPNLCAPCCYSDRSNLSKGLWLIRLLWIIWYRLSFWLAFQWKSLLCCFRSDASPKSFIALVENFFWFDWSVQRILTSPMNVSELLWILHFERVVKIVRKKRVNVSVSMLVLNVLRNLLRHSDHSSVVWN
jgi:hypothetical protein